MTVNVQGDTNSVTVNVDTSHAPSEILGFLRGLFGGDTSGWDGDTSGWNGITDSAQNSFDSVMIKSDLLSILPVLVAVAPVLVFISSVLSLMLLSVIPCSISSL